MNISLVEKKLKTKWCDKKIHYKEEADSTNSWALRAINNGAQRGEVFLTDFQTSGRGRLDRRWESPPQKNLLVSFIDSLPPDPAHAPHLTLVAGAAFCNGINSFCMESKTELQWPNDLFLKGKKMGGILSVCHAKAPLAVIGIGLNVNATPPDFPPLLRDQATSLKVCHGREYERESLLAVCLNEYEKWRGIYDQKGIGPVLDFWKENSWMMGKKVKVFEAAQTYEGVALNMDSDGFLLVQTEPTIKKVVSGDVLVL